MPGPVAGPGFSCAGTGRSSCLPSEPDCFLPCSDVDHGARGFRRTSGTSDEALYTSDRVVAAVLTVVGNALISRG